MQIDMQRRLHSIKIEQTTAEDAYRHKLRKIRHNQFIKSGSRYYCPICECWFRHFRPFGLRRRPNSECPRCGSLERHRFLWLYMDRQTDILYRRRAILHVAPEPCIQRVLRTKLGITRYLAIDRYDNDANADQQDLTDLPYAEGSFDLVLCNHVLEHIPNDVKALREIRRIISYSGRALITVPIDRSRKNTYENPNISSPADRHQTFGHPYHVRICGTDYGNRIQAAGFKVSEVHSTYMSKHKLRINRISKSIIYDCQPS